MITTHSVTRYSVLQRKSKVRASDFAGLPAKGASFRRFFETLPHILKADDLREVVASIVKAKKSGKAVIFMAGAHVIKCGLSPLVIELIKRKVITCVCLNGAGIIHDFELALQAKTSEDVAANLANGSFGMGKEPADFLNAAVSDGVALGMGLGASVGKKIAESKLRYKKLSILGNAYAYQVPVCVFVAMGTDIIHQHPSFDAASTGEGSLRDFHTLTEHIAKLNKGGVALNFGSAVILPEVFLKALNLARNMKRPVKDFITATFDMNYHYRPAQNVVSRPVMSGGKGHYIIGHHEIMLPLLTQAVIERL